MCHKGRGLFGGIKGNEGEKGNEKPFRDWTGVQFLNERKMGRKDLAGKEKL